MATVLVVDDDRAVLRAVEVSLRGTLSCVLVQTPDAAMGELEERKFDGLVLDISLGHDLSGFELLEVARARGFEGPVVFISGMLSHENVNRAARANARFVVKPWGRDTLEPFILDVLTRNGTRAVRAAEGARIHYRLTDRETEVLAAMLRGQDRDAFMAEAGITTNTFKIHVRNILAKAKAPNVAKLIVELLRDFT